MACSLAGWRPGAAWVLMGLCAWALSGCDQAPTVLQSEMSLSQLAARNSKAVYAVTTYDVIGMEAATGTAFAISDDGVLVTNYHVVKHAPKITVSNGEGGKALRVKEILAYEEKVDLAILQLEDGVDTPHFVKRAPLERVNVGAKVAVIGGPLGLTGTLSEGIVSAKRAVDEGDWHCEMIQTTAAISPGSSGSPVFLMDGRVAGVATMCLIGGQQLNFAVAADHIDELLDMATAKTRRRVLKELPMDSGDPFYKDEAYLKVAQAFDDGNLDLALDRMRPLLPKYPKSASAHAVVGEILRRQGRQTEAMPFLQKALNMEKDLGWIWGSYGKVLHREEHFNEAVKAYQQAVRLDSADEEVHAGFGELLVMAERPADAIDQYKKAVELKSDVPRWWRDLARLYVKERKFDDALSCARNALALDSDVSTLMLARDCARKLGHPTAEFDTELNRLGAVLAAQPAVVPGSSRSSAPVISGAPSPGGGSRAPVVSSTVIDPKKAQFLGTWGGEKMSITMSLGGSFRVNMNANVVSGTWEQLSPTSARLKIVGVDKIGSFSMNGDLAQVSVPTKGGRRHSFTAER